MSTTLDYVASHPALNCVRPLMFENSEFADYPYSIGATGFLVGYRKRVFLVTAKHCLKDRDVHDLRIDVSYGRGRFIPFCMFMSSNDSLCGKWADSDIAILETPLDQYEDADRRLLNEFDLDFQVGRPEIPHQGQLAFCGYPFSISSIDYEGQRISRRLFVSLADFVERGSRHGLFWAKFDTPLPHAVETINGLSGSPVFQFGGDGKRGVAVNIAGMVLSGTVQSGKIQFITTNALLSRMETICQI